MTEGRYLLGQGIIFAEDFFTRALSDVQMRRANLTGALVVRVAHPVPAIVVMFGAGNCWLDDNPCRACRYTSTTEAEVAAFSRFLSVIDPERKHGFTSGLLHVDLREAGGKVIRQPTETENAMLHLRFRGLDATPVRVQREIRAAQRRLMLPPAPKKHKIQPKTTDGSARDLVQELFGPDSDKKP
jgi:hypothetical protein